MDDASQTEATGCAVLSGGTGTAQVQQFWSQSMWHPVQCSENAFGARTRSTQGAAVDRPLCLVTTKPERSPAKTLEIDRLLVVGPHLDHDDVLHICEAMRSRGYHTECLAPSHRAQLVAALRAGEVRVLVLHVELLETIALEDLLRLRRQFPAVHWVLAWRSRSPRWVELVVHFQARGCIDCDDARTFGRAIDTVVAGDLWFPRWLTHSLYLSLLAAVNVARHTTAGKEASPGASLTQREAEALELMRKGLTNKQIAWRLDISVNTVKKHLKHAFEKRGLHSRRQMLSRGLALFTTLLATFAEIVGLDLV